MDGAPVKLVSPSSMNPYTVKAGTAKGKLIGGNMSLLTNLLGSKYAPLSAFQGAILFLEDVEEVPYKIDRYFTQLALFGVLDVVNGVMFGQCTSCTTRYKTKYFSSFNLIIVQQVAPRSPFNKFSIIISQIEHTHRLPELNLVISEYNGLFLLVLWRRSMRLSFQFLSMQQFNKVGSKMFCECVF